MTTSSKGQSVDQNDAICGTITGWRLLSDQIMRSAEDANSSDDHIAADGSISSGPHQPWPQHAADSADDHAIGAGGSDGAGVATKPLHLMYEEYEILEEIGAGGFGRVHKALRRSDGRTVVAKEVRTAGLTPKQRATAMEEVHVLSSLDHPNIVRYHDCYCDAGGLHIMMEHCNGGDLGRLLKAQAGRLLPEEDVMIKFVQVCLALHYMHARGVLHRDLKTSNVFVSEMGVLKLGDFGVSKMANSDASMIATLVGTPQYMSPEMCDNKPYGKKSDVWALGCILCELCTLAHAFDETSMSKIILRILSGRYNPVPTAYSEDLRQLVAQMLSPNPRDRPSVRQVLRQSYVRQYAEQFLYLMRNRMTRTSTCWEGADGDLDAASPLRGNSRTNVVNGAATGGTNQLQMMGELSPLMQEQLESVNKVRLLKLQLSAPLACQ